MTLSRRAFLPMLPALGLRGAQNDRAPNIVILLADDLGWADAGYHQSEIHTPNIDRLAAQGTRFERYYAFPLCSPTRSALMTGRSPIRLGVVYATIEPFDDHGVPLEEHFMPQTLKAAGYETAMAGKWHLGHTRRQFFPNARGFDHSYGCINGRIDYFTHDREGGLDWHRDGNTSFEQGYSTELIGREAIRLIRRRDKNKPLFLYVPFNAPHAPLHQPPKYADNYAHIQDADRRHFCATVQYMDDVIGRILGTLDEEQMTNDTLVMFFSDNGGPTALGAKNTPLRGGKRSTYEGGIRVPMILRWPGRLRASAVSNQVMTVMDVFPTLAAVAATTPGNKLPLDGKNLWPAISGGRVEARDDLFFGTGSGSMFTYGVLHQEWKLVRTISRKNQSATNELFRIEDDPTEKHDLAAQHPDLVKDLAARIDRWRELYPADGIIDPKKDAPPGKHAPKQWAEAAR
jgi:arylsulfatase B